MFALVAFVGLIVVLYSRNYLDGDRGQARFTKWLCLTLAAVLLLIVSGNLFQFALAWIATSLGLNKLLLFYPERQSAVLAARKKFLVSRLGDLCLIAAMVLLHQAFGSLDYAVLFAGAEAMRLGGDIPAVIHAVALLLVVAALLKSAQFPLHGWLTEVMETPTPVSALLHAGVINAGGFLVLRLADVISLSAPSMEVLVIVGGVTALFGSVVMLTQTSVKVSLAYSTIAQMGFMMWPRGFRRRAAAHRCPLTLQGARLPRVGQRHRPRAGVLVAEPRRPAAPSAHGDDRWSGAGGGAGRGDAVRRYHYRATGGVRARRGRDARSLAPHHPGLR